jgi:beta-fructofuranosidase
MQYFKPDGATAFAGDCMPFFHDGTFHLYYLLDENHHASLGGLGGHQWAHASTIDLAHWTHHPLAIGITHDFEGSICTGTTFFHDGTYYGYYATRMRDWTQHLCVATSRDGIHFEKSATNPFASPPAGYHPHHYRDPFIFRDEHTGLFHLLVTAMLDPYPLHNLGGCVAHLVSPDLQGWEVTAPFTIPGLPDAPECPDYFKWNDWYYLVYSNGGIARYRMSRDPLAAWTCPRVDILEAGAAVMKTAPFTGNRRIGAAWVWTRDGDRDAGRRQWGGHVVFRELIQHDDGSIGTKWVDEMIPDLPLIALNATAMTPHVETAPGAVNLHLTDGLEVAELAGVAHNARFHLHVSPAATTSLFGLRLRSRAGMTGGYDLRILPHEGRVELFAQAMTCVDGLDKPFTLDVVMVDGLIDVCVDNRRCLINRCPEQTGDRAYLYARGGAVEIGV